MPSKIELHEIKCPKCNKTYTVQTPAYKRKLNNPKYGMLCTSCRAKVLWEEMSPEQKQMMKEKSDKGRKERFKNMTDEEKKELSKKRSEISKNMWANMSAEKMKELSKIRSKNQKALMASKTPEEKKKLGEKISKSNKEHFANMTDEEREKFLAFRRKERKIYWNSLSEERKKELMTNLTAKSVEAYNNLSEEDKRKQWIDGVKACQNFWHSLNDQEKEKYFNIRSNNTITAWNNLSDEDKIRRINLLKDGNNNFWKNLTGDKRKEFIEKRSKALKDYLESLSKEEYKNYCKQFSDIQKAAWDNMTPEERAKRASKSFKVGSKSNLNLEFENKFNSSILSQKFYIIDEYITANDDHSHRWDYAIFDKDNKELVALIDIDGRFYHGDNKDYNGIQSKEELDLKRSLILSNDIKVKIIIIYEENFNKSFDYLIRVLDLNYNEYIKYYFNQMRSIPFPIPYYSDKDLIISYTELMKMKCDDKYHKNISLNTRLGDRLIHHFHSSIYSAHIKGKISPQDAWYDDKILMKCIEDHIIYHSYLNHNKILQGFNVSKIAPKVSVFSAGRAKMLIYKYLNEYNTIFDPFSGFSGRMLGALSLGKKYIGQDISEVHINESKKMIDFLSEYKLINKDDVNINIADTSKTKGTYECLFTCPPYSDKEIWIDTPVSKLSCDEWIDICLNHFKCKKYLFIVDKTEKYKDYIVDIIENKSHLNGNDEYVILV